MTPNELADFIDTMADLDDYMAEQRRKMREAQDATPRYWSDELKMWVTIPED